MSGQQNAPTGSISAERLWKRFRTEGGDLGDLGAAPTAPVRRRLGPLAGRVRRDWRWVLREANLQVSPGESVGLVGLNGSGKSTMLKLLSGAMFPYSGRIHVQGRIGALIEVRSGIHPELTGRENVFINGTLLGMPRREVMARFTDIIEFAELGPAVDRQVKFYSSGMQMRLGFSIAAFLEPDILLVDEALAVGDVGFQQRCLDRMRTVLADGTTVVFVSHDLSAVEAMCTRALWLDNGAIRADGEVHEVIGHYRRDIERKAAAYVSRLRDPIRSIASHVRNPGGGSPRTGQVLEVELTLETQEQIPVVLAIGVSEGPAAPVFAVTQSTVLPSGTSLHRCRIDSLPLPGGRYYLWAGAWRHSGATGMTWQPVAPLDVEGPGRQRTPTGVQLMSPVYVPSRWEQAGGTTSGLAEGLPSQVGPHPPGWDHG